MSLIKLTKEIQAKVGVTPDGVYGPNTAASILASLDPVGAENFPHDPDDQPFDPRTEKSLATLQPKAQKAFRPFVRRAMAIAASMGVDLKVISGHRGAVDQEKAKASGASKAGYGFSWHNYGMAIDLGCFRGNVYVDSTKPAVAESVYRAIGAIAKEYKIEWGGNWKSFKDTPHFQIDLGRSTPKASDRAQLYAGTWKF